MKKIFTLLLILFFAKNLHAQIALSSFQAPNFTEPNGFNGSIQVASNKYSSAPESANFVMGTSDFTMECWAYPTSSPSGWNSIISMGLVSGQNGHEIRIGTSDADNKLGFVIPNASNDNDLWVSTGAAMTLNVWTHLALVRNGLRVSLFVNGIESAFQTLLTSGEMNHVGNGAGGSGQFWINNDGWNHENFNGYISNVRLVKGTAIYASNFTPSTIPPTNVTNTQLLMNTIYGFGNKYLEDISANAYMVTPAGTVKSKMSPYIISERLKLRLDASIVASYPGNGNTWTDLSGKGNHGTFINSPTYSNGAMVFNGSNYVRIPAAESNFIQGQVTVAAWIKPTNVNVNQGIVLKGDYFSDRSIGLELLPNRRLGYTYNPGTIVQSPQFVMANDTWFYAVVTVNSVGLVSFYINGSLIGTVQGSLTYVATQTHYLTIGAADDGASIRFVGSIAEVLLYGRALTTSEILTNYNIEKSRFAL